MKNKIFTIVILFMLIFSCSKVVFSTDLYDTTVTRIQENGENISTTENSEITIEGDKELESAVYIINDAEKMIYRVIPETNVEDFKTNFSIPENIKVYKNISCEEEVVDGYVGTGMALVNELTSQIYTISVIGDFDSDGCINQIEITNLIDHVVGLQEYQLEDAKKRAADLNNDNILNHVDITLLIRYIVFGELDIEENREISSPRIEIISGTEGENEWYISDVKFRVICTEIATDKIEKTTYKISGSNTITETEINENEEITLTQGTYYISAYTYGKQGFKSLAARKTIKIDTTKPEVGSVDMWLNEKNGELYIDGEWTNQNVFLSLNNGKDSESGHYRTTYYIKNNDILPEGSTEDILLTSSGTYPIIVETVDNAGNISTREYTVKIDNMQTVKPIINIVKGEQNEGSSWYVGDEVILQIVNGMQDVSGSNIVKTTYTMEGQKEIEETEINNEGLITINENGTYTITAYSYNEIGEKSEGTTITIMYDNSIPDAPQIEVTSGEIEENSQWYKGKVTLQVTQTNVAENLSPITRITYVIDGANQTEETEIQNLSNIEITEDGISTITVYNYNEAGTRSEGNEIVIYKDETAPNKSVIEANDIKPTEFTLLGQGEDATSGVITYEFYLDDNLIQTINTTESQAEVLVQNQTSGIHKAYIIVKDAAGNITKSNVIDVKTARLTKEEIAYFEFVVTNFTITNDQGEIFKEGITATVSDTSLTQNSKYIMLNSETQNLTGTVTGELRLIRTDGTVVKEFDYFPEDLIINMSYYANGSGSTFSHNNTVTFFGIDLNSEKVADGNSVNTEVSITSESVTENRFTITDEKLTGTQTYTRATIQSISLNGENLDFRIIQEPLQTN